MAERKAWFKTSNDEVISLPGILKKDISKTSSKNAAFHFVGSLPSEYTEMSTKNENGDTISIGQFSISPTKTKSVKSMGSNSKTVTIRSHSIDEFNFEKKTPSLSKWHVFKNNLNKGTFQPKLPDLIQYNNLKLKRYTLYDLNEFKKETEVGDDKEISVKTIEPTYRMEPVKKFDRATAEKIIHEVLNNFIENLFSTEMMSSSSSVKSCIEHLTTTIKSRMKTIADQRYKIIVNTTISEQKYQGLIIASKCLWDTENDISINIKETYKNYVFLINLYLVYHE